MPSVIALWCVAAFLRLALLAAAIGRSRGATAIIYGAAFVIALVATAAALAQLTGEGAAVSNIVLPLGLPWVGAHFRLDALSAFFLVVVDLGAAAASLYAIGYGRHDG